MGWLFIPRLKTKIDLIEYLQDVDKNALAWRVRGNHLWSVQQWDFDDSGKARQRYIGVYLLSCQSGMWGYKFISESCGPVALDCPLGFLNRSTDNSDYAVSWRAKVRGAAAAKKQTRADLARARAGYVFADSFADCFSDADPGL